MPPVGQDPPGGDDLEGQGGQPVVEVDQMRAGPDGRDGAADVHPGHRCHVHDQAAARRPARVGVPPGPGRDRHTVLADERQAGRYVMRITAVGDPGRVERVEARVELPFGDGIGGLARPHQGSGQIVAQRRPVRGRGRRGRGTNRRGCAARRRADRARGPACGSARGARSAAPGARGEQPGASGRRSEPQECAASRRPTRGFPGHRPATLGVPAFASGLDHRGQPPLRRAPCFLASFPVGALAVKTPPGGKQLARVRLLIRARARRVNAIFTCLLEQAEI